MVAGTISVLDFHGRQRNIIHDLWAKSSSIYTKDNIVLSNFLLNTGSRESVPYVHNHRGHRVRSAIT